MCGSTRCTNFVEVGQSVPMSAATTAVGWWQIRPTDTRYARLMQAGTLLLQYLDATTQPPPPPTAPTALGTTVISLHADQSGAGRTVPAMKTALRSSVVGAWCTNFVEVGQVRSECHHLQQHGLMANSVYRYQVRAFNAGGNSGYSNISTATTQPPPAPQRRLLSAPPLFPPLRSISAGLIAPVMKTDSRWNGVREQAARTLSRSVRPVRMSPPTTVRAWLRIPLTDTRYARLIRAATLPTPIFQQPRHNHRRRQLRQRPWEQCHLRHAD